MGFKGDWTVVGKTGVESGAVIKGFDVVEDGMASFGEGGEALVVDHFIFEAAPEGFDEGVVVAVSFPAHGSDQAMLGEDLPISGAGKLRAIDWTYSNDRTRFQREIDAASQTLIDKKTLAAVILLGFSGYFNPTNPIDPWNEELVPVIRSLRASGFDSTYMAVHREQYLRKSSPSYGLMQELDACGRCLSYDKARNFMVDLLSKNSFRFPYRFVDNEYSLWSRWYLSGTEPKHS